MPIYLFSPAITPKQRPPHSPFNPLRGKLFIETSKQNYLFADNHEDQNIRQW